MKNKRLANKINNGTDMIMPPHKYIPSGQINCIELESNGLSVTEPWVPWFNCIHSWFRYSITLSAISLELCKFLQYLSFYMLFNEYRCKKLKSWQKNHPWKRKTSVMMMTKWRTNTNHGHSSFGDTSTSFTNVSIISSEFIMTKRLQW